MQTSSEAADVGVGVPYRRYEFLYDNLGRRVARLTFGGSYGSKSLERTDYFIWRGWTLLAEVKSDWSEELYFTQGLDLASSLTATGNVGSFLGIRVVTTGTTVGFPHYDGNGNVLSYTEADGDQLMSREYDAFGNTVLQRGTDANGRKSLPWFSSKICDEETRLYYYGYRYYDRADIESRVRVRAVGRGWTCNTLMKECTFANGVGTQLGGSVQTTLRVESPGTWTISGSVFVSVYAKGRFAGADASVYLGNNGGVPNIVVKTSHSGLGEDFHIDEGPPLGVKVAWVNHDWTLSFHVGAGGATLPLVGIIKNATTADGGTRADVASVDAEIHVKEILRDGVSKAFDRKHDGVDRRYISGSGPD